MAVALAPPERPTMRAVQLAPDHPAVVALHQRYCDRFGLGERDPRYGFDRFWVGVEHEGRVLAVFSEKENPDDRALEILDAYCEPTRAGWKALVAGALRYKALVDSGDIDRLRHTILWANKRWWRMVLEATQDEPLALVFEHRRKGA